MGSKEKTTTTTQATSTPTADPSMVEMNKLDLDLRKQNQQGLGEVQSNSLNLANLLLRGLQLPGYLQSLPGGISEDVISDMTNKSLNDVNYQLANSGAGSFLESGASQAIGARTAGDIRNNAAQFNLQSLQQLLNLATGNAAQVQSPIISQSGNLGQRLAGLTSVNQTGLSNFRSNQNPFLNSFAGGLGQGVGSGFFS